MAARTVADKAADNPGPPADSQALGNADSSSIPTWAGAATDADLGVEPLEPIPDGELIEPALDPLAAEEAARDTWYEYVPASRPATSRVKARRLFNGRLRRLLRPPGQPPLWRRWFSGPLNARGGGDQGIGFERVVFAPFMIDTTQPLKFTGLRLDMAGGVESPDLAEYFWSKAGGKGPPEPETRYNYQDIKYVFSVGGPRNAIITELPIRFVDPTVNDNHSGLGDVTITLKTLLLDGERIQLSSHFKTYILSGSAGAGLGTGHMSLEPGLLARYRLHDSLYAHGQMKFWIPLGADEVHAGQALEWGFGISQVMYDSDLYALMPTLEFVGLSALNGQRTVAPGGGIEDVDGDTFVMIAPGIRAVLDEPCDFGLPELGLSTGISVTDGGWYSSLIRFELRWSR